MKTFNEFLNEAIINESPLDDSNIKRMIDKLQNDFKSKNVKIERVTLKPNKDKPNYKEDYIYIKKNGQENDLFNGNFFKYILDL